MSEIKTEPHRQIIWKARKNRPYDERGASRALFDLFSRTAPGEQCCKSDNSFLAKPGSSKPKVSFEDVTYLFRDLYMPQLAEQGGQT